MIIHSRKRASVGNATKVVEPEVEKINIEEEKPIKITKRKPKKVFEELDFELDSQE